MTNRYRRAKYSPRQVILGALLIVPALVLFITAFYLLVALIGALPLMLIWNLGLVEFLSATGLGTVAKVGFWGAFKIGLLTAWLTVLLGSVGSLGRSKSSG